MKIALFVSNYQGRGCANKDLAGSMGTRSLIGDSWRARLLELVKKRSVALPIISLAYLAAIFKKFNHQVEYWENRIGEADLVLMQTSIIDHQKDLHWAKKIKKKKLKLGFCGAFSSFQPDVYLKSGDLVIIGEPENACLKIASTGRIPKGKVISQVVQNLDKLPFPDWSCFPFRQYSYFPAMTKKPVLAILSSRGCPFPCGYYCSYPAFQGKKWRKRSVENVISEIKYLIKEYRVKALDFRDPNFTIDKDRAREIALALIKNKIRIDWSCETHLLVLDKKLLKTFYRAGLKNINVGIETSDDQVLKASKRLSASLKHQKEIIDYCHRLGINVACFYIFGLPAENKQSIEKTIRYSQELNTLVAQFSICTPYPGTEFFKKVKNKIISNNWEDFNQYTPVFKSENLSPKQLLSYKEKAWVNYYFRPAYFYRFITSFLK